jgi:hypothetical protein
MVNNVLVVPFRGFVEQLPFSGDELTMKLIELVLILDSTR